MLIEEKIKQLRDITTGRWDDLTHGLFPLGCIDRHFPLELEINL
jgi:hypothetical protein